MGLVRNDYSLCFFWVIAMVAAIKIEKDQERKKNIQTYAEILAFY
jgi:hypothetical protein